LFNNNPFAGLADVLPSRFMQRRGEMQAQIKALEGRLPSGLWSELQREAAPNRDEKDVPAAATVARCGHLFQ
jgi:hypothetical protein